MNEQIEELARKAGIGILYDYSEQDDPDGFSPHAGVCDLKDINKFAELLIQEVCKLIEPDEEWRKDASWGYLGGEEGVELLDGAVRTIKGHFGVQS
jgi:hypothetical protein